MRWYYWTGLIAVVAVVAGYFYVQSRLSAPLINDARIAQMKEDIEAEDESAFVIPPPQPVEYPAESLFGSAPVPDPQIPFGTKSPRFLDE